MIINLSILQIYIKALNKKENKKKENAIKYWYYKSYFNYKIFYKYSFIKIHKMYLTIVSTAYINLNSKNIDSTIL